MQYAILCYHDEDVVCSWTKEEDDSRHGQACASCRTGSPRPASSGPSPG